MMTSDELYATGWESWNAVVVQMMDDEQMKPRVIYTCPSCFSSIMAENVSAHIRYHQQLEDYIKSLGNTRAI